MIKTILFDLDDTLYPAQVGIMNEIRVLILRYIETRLKLSPAEADALRHRYLQAYGTTMRGLQLNHQIDPNDYLEFVHDIPLHKYLKPNPRLDSVLASIPQGKVIFTNASREHAENVLALLDIRRHFVRIVDIRDMNFESKPQPTAYQRVCQMLDALPEECVLVEDNARNLPPAQALGMTTVLVQDGTADARDQADYVISRVEEIGKVLALLPEST